MSEPRLQPGETIVFETHPGGYGLLGRYVLSLGWYKFWREAAYFTVTDQRVIQSYGLLLSKSQRSVPVDMVQDASVQTSMGIGTVLVSTAGGPSSVERFGPLPAETARELSDAILQQRNKARAR
jgi:Bacterial PH domain